MLSGEIRNKLIVRAFLLMLVAVLAFAVLTLSFVVEIPDNVGQRSYPVIVGIAKQPLPQCGTEPCGSVEDCLRRWGVTRDGGMVCSGGQGRVIFAEALIFATYVTIALALGCLGALLRIGRSSPDPKPDPKPDPAA